MPHQTYLHHTLTRHAVTNAAVCYRTRKYKIAQDENLTYSYMLRRLRWFLRNAVIAILVFQVNLLRVNIIMNNKIQVSTRPRLRAVSEKDVYRTLLTTHILKHSSDKICKHFMQCYILSKPDYFVNKK